MKTLTTFEPLTKEQMYEKIHARSKSRRDALKAKPISITLPTERNRLYINISPNDRVTVQVGDTLVVVASDHKGRATTKTLYLPTKAGA